MDEVFELENRNMYEVIRTFEIKGMTDETKNEILDVLKFLTIFALGQSEHLKQNSFSDLLVIWCIKMEKLGWKPKHVAVLVQAFTREYRTNKKFTKNTKPRPYPQYEKRLRKHFDFTKKRPDIVYEGCQFTKLENSVRAKITDDKKEKILNSLTKIQYEYYDALYIKRLTVEGTAKYLKKDVESVQKMQKILEAKFTETLESDVNESLIDNENLSVAEGNPDDETNFETDKEEVCEDDEG